MVLCKNFIRYTTYFYTYFEIKFRAKVKVVFKKYIFYETFNIKYTLKPNKCLFYNKLIEKITLYLACLFCSTASTSSSRTSLAANSTNK